ncbi:MAG: cryptochrome/photolyase family protein [Saprospiraceae bacterium]|nr:cryptochrome/photolyase family protein [Saprospiraceae bacterium]
MSKETVNIVFPHQLYEDHPSLGNDAPVYLIEEYLFFKQFKFHKQKLAFHRATMKFYEDYLSSKGKEVIYVESAEDRSDVRELINHLDQKGVSQIEVVDVVDDWLERRLGKAEEIGMELVIHDTPGFINQRDDLMAFFRKDKKKYFQTSFYKSERKRLDILIEGNDSPMGGKWSFDDENREKYPRDKAPPVIDFPERNEYHKEAIDYVNQNFKNCPGALSEEPLYPVTFDQMNQWVQQFYECRFHEFGTYEDAIVKDEVFLNHGVLSPGLNVGLITPGVIVEKSIAYAGAHDVPINSLEGFIRQIIGWREFIRGVYIVKGREERTKNFWGFKRKIPASFYTGETGIDPIDITIKKVINTGYCHHIERLMVLGNFMVLCEFDPDEVYRWFMELFIDAYDWVMVPNVYGMSQYADGGLMSTKPYISSSNYLMKMSDYKKGDWNKVWDGLFWRFMYVHRSFFESNPRLGMLVRNLDRMSEDKLNGHLEVAENFLESL